MSGHCLSLEEAISKKNSFKQEVLHQRQWWIKVNQLVMTGVDICECNFLFFFFILQCNCTCVCNTNVSIKHSASGLFTYISNASYYQACLNPVILSLSHTTVRTWKSVRLNFRRLNIMTFKGSLFLRSCANTHPPVELNRYIEENAPLLRFLVFVLREV